MVQLWSEVNISYTGKQTFEKFETQFLFIMLHFLLMQLYIKHMHIY